MKAIPCATPDGIGANQGTIGVVGVAPWSTLDFCRILYEQIAATKDWHYPRVLVDVNTKIPSRGRHFELGEQDFTPFLKSSISAIIDRGATVVVVPCNTAHIYYSRWAQDAAVPIPNIGRECVQEMGNKGARAVSILGGLSLLASGFYQSLLQGAGFEVVETLESEANTSAEIIEEVKMHGDISAQTRDAAVTMLRELAARGADGLILGCTELSSLLPISKGIIPRVVESNGALARAAVRLSAPSMLIGAGV